MAAEERKDGFLDTTLVGRTRPGERRVPRAVAIEVEVLGGPMDGARRRVPKSVMTIGRGEGNDLVLALDPRVSTHHARIVERDGRYLLEDLGSTNGTYVGVEKVEQQALIGPGTVFLVGRTRIELAAP